MEDLLSSILRRQNIVQTWTVSEILLVALICALLTWYLQFLWQKRNLYLSSYKLPGPLALPLIGSALHFIGNPYDIFSTMMKMYNHYPGIFCVWFGARMFCAISEPRYYEILLPNCLKKDQWYEYMEPVVGHGLVTAPLEKWKRHRKIIAPTFNQRILDGFVEVFSEQSEVLVEQLKRIAGKGEFDIFDALSNCTLDIICETAMGVKVNAQTNENASVSTWIDRVMETIFIRVFVFWYHSDTIFNLTSMSKEFSKSIQYLDEFSGTVVREKKRLFDEAKKQNVEATQTFWKEGGRFDSIFCILGLFVLGYKRKAFSDYLLEITSDGNIFTEEELRDEVNTFIIAGSDTTASTISFAFVSLGLHNDFQERVYEEIIEVVGPNRAVEQRDLPKLKYMERFIKETLRFFPVAGFVVRAVDEDVDLGDHIVPAGVSVIFGIIKTHTDEKYWPDPFRFNPDRFLPEEVAKRHPCAYLPFSYGPRNCLGLKYAMMAMKALIATVLREFKVSTSYKDIQDIKLRSHVVLRPTDGYKVSLELR